ncbi:hypothetical protein BpHYR1_022861 [Brachionus plicatilis]|uniref:Uncharacterized protein n=1 Tax=Brachionus plicatilis TaxID=10195 RepID=A0A3M7RA12_BRAPC|nr:hypothetical protein BpHYR1_022861 [Brachionus plicatilis]
MIKTLKLLNLFTLFKILINLDADQNVYLAFVEKKNRFLALKHEYYGTKKSESIPVVYTKYTGTNEVFAKKIIIT